ncbi:hypothetical protein PsorP6_001638 [Peronosclerospora sorghi]|uniref:Uncharacterized protein n=1 Tax=Peronosclerospora sorghi TaxID=230839 RepID=A0ACC0WPH5_9STRA|nr:hypothetical protein PsorP6_001638 [Peronosclerospora sorghi]
MGAAKRISMVDTIPLNSVYKIESYAIDMHAEYIALPMATQEIVWIHFLLAELGLHFGGASTILLENKSATSIATNKDIHHVPNILLIHDAAKECIQDSTHAVPLLQQDIPRGGGFFSTGPAVGSAPRRAWVVKTLG